MALYSYSARDHAIVITSPVMGSHVVSGYGPDEFFGISFNDDDWTSEEGADGYNVVRSRMPNQIATITLTLQASSTTNRLFNVLRNMDKAVPDSGVFSFSLKGPQMVNSGVPGAIVPSAINTLKVTATTAYIKKIADNSLAKTAGTRAWTLELVDPIIAESAVETLGALGMNVAAAAGIISRL